MMIFKKAIPRRTFLRGAGATLALPFLDAMIPAATAAPTAPLRLGYVYLPIGRIMSMWTPAEDGGNYTMTPSLEPIARFRKDFSILSGMNIKAADPRPGEAGGTHARPCASYLTGVHPAPNKSIGISVDQVIARQLAQHTQLSSLELGLDPAEFAGGDEAAYSGYFRATIAWRSPTTPLPTENNPRKVFERLFGDTDSANRAEQIKRIQREKSVLDSVSRRVSRLMNDVGSGDRIKLSEYLDAVRDVERRIQVAERTTSPAASDSDQDAGMRRPAGIPESYSEHAKIIFDLMWLTYRTDLTRVVTFMMGHEGTNRTYKEIGASDGHHSLSHHRGDQVSIELLKKIDLYQSQLLAYFLDKMANTQDGEGSLLDHSMIISGSSLSDGNLHLHNDVPTLVIGRANGRIKTGQHIRYDGEPFSDLHRTTIEVMGVTPEGFQREDSDSTGKVGGILA
jgi:hypothetical protein